MASGTRAALAVGWPVSLLPRMETHSSRRKVGCILSKGLICLLFFCKVFLKATGPRSTQSNGTEASPKGFSPEKLLPKVNRQTEGPFLFLRGGKCPELYVHLSTPTRLLLRGGGGGVFIQMSILREKSKVLQPCTVYIY